MEEPIIKKADFYQVWVEDTKTGELIPCPFFPRAVREVADQWADEVRLMISAGKEKRFSNPQVLLHVNL
jgi:hypothetical protein